MTQFKYHYIKFVLILLACLLTLTTISNSAQSQLGTPLLEMFTSIPQNPVYPQMNALTISYADYRAIERANGVPNPASRDEYTAMDATIQSWWQLSLLRIHAGPTSFANLTQEKIEDMPELMGFDYFDMDRALVYGAAPYIGTLVHNEDATFSWSHISDALAARGYDPRRSAAGIAWGKGGDGMTDLDNIALGDPFGGDVGLASRVAVFDSSIVANSTLWGVVLDSADTYTQEVPSLAAVPAYQAVTAALQPVEGELLQAVILNQLAGQSQQPQAGIETLPLYELAAIADIQIAETQVHRVITVHTEADLAEQAAETLPQLIHDFDNGWFQTIGFDVMPAEVIPVDDFFVVQMDITAKAPTPQDLNDGAFEPAIVFGFWATAIEQGNFYPLALNTAD